MMAVSETERAAGKYPTEEQEKSIGINQISFTRKELMEMTTRNRAAKFAQAFALFTLIAVFAAAAFPSASFASARTAKSPAPKGKVVLYVFDQNTGKPIAGAQAIFRHSDSSVVVVAKAMADANGVIELELRAASYVVEVTAHNYKPAGLGFDVASGIRNELKIELAPDSTVSTPPPPMH